MVEMSETALNFGPEWLRALSHGNLPSSPPASPGNVKFKLAEFRYGREEMLALFSEVVKPPDGFREEFHDLYVDKCQFPLALSHLSSDEQRSWQRSVNSEAALRSMGRGGGTVPPNLNVSRGRGGSVDRGRIGRSRGGFYMRPISLADDEKDSNLIRRVRPGFERSSSLHDRSWPEKNGPDDGRTARRVSAADNWTARDKPDWRARDKPDWRDAEYDQDKNKEGSCVLRGGGKNYNKSGGDLCEDESWSKSKNFGDDDVSKPSRYIGRIGRGRSSNLSRHHSDDRDLPEWSNISTTANVGSFDASGAFHGSEWDGDVEEKSDSAPDCIDEHYIDNHAEIQAFTETPVISETVSNDNSSHLIIKQEESSCHSNQILFKSVESIDTQVPMTIVESNDNNVTDIQSDKQSQGLCNNHDKVSNEVKYEGPIQNQTDLQLNKINAVHNNDDCIVSQSKKTNVPISELSVSTTDHPPNTLFTISPVLPQCLYSLESKNLSSSILKLKNNEEENIENMKAVANNLVAKLMEDDDKENDKFKDLSDEKWFYRDPQGEIQGPFTSSEMNEWFTAGYFSSDLLLRRECDERFAQLGQLMEMWDKVPFIPGPSPPPLKCAPVAAMPSVPHLPINNLDKVNAVLQQQMLQQQYQKQLLQHPQLPMNSQSTLQRVLSKLQQSDGWSSMSPQQQKLINHQLDPTILHMKLQQVDQKGRHPIWPHPNVTEDSILTQLKHQFDIENKPPVKIGTDPIQQLIAQMQAPSLAPKPIDPLQQLLLQLQKSCENSKTPPQVPLPPQSNPIHLIPPVLKPVGPSLVPPDPVVSKSVPVDYVWGNAFGTWPVEQDKDRRDREEKLKQQDVAVSLKTSSLLNAWKQDDDDDEQRQAELRKEEERLKEVRKQVEDKIKMLEEVKLEEERRRRMEEESRKKEEELSRRKEIEKRRKTEEQERKKEERKRQELLLQDEERRKLEEQKKLEKESQRLEEERQREINQTEIFVTEKLQEQPAVKSSAPAWGGQGIKPSVNCAAPSLLEIQRMQEEKEKTEQKLKWQGIAIAQQKEQQQKKIGNLKWANKTLDCVNVKSLAEIQAEEAEKLFKEKEKELAERVLTQVSSNVPGPAWNSTKSKLWSSKVATTFPVTSQSSWETSPKGPVVAPGTGTVWAGTNQSLVTCNSVSPSWDGVSQYKTNPSTTPSKSKSPKNGGASGVNNIGKLGKGKLRTEEEENDQASTVVTKQTDGFTDWCTRALSELQTSVDIPTFISFLKDVESPYEVTDYVRMYMESEKEAKEFAKQFLERRSKWKNAQRANHKVPEDNMYCPAAAITPSCVEFQEVKAKNRNKKKGSRMQKVDSSILGFNVTADPDRINVGERDFVEGM